jgi:hypothetical protein
MADEDRVNPGFLLPPPLTYLLPLVFGLLLDRRIHILRECSPLAIIDTIEGLRVNLWRGFE